MIWMLDARIAHTCRAHHAPARPPHHCPPTGALHSTTGAPPIGPSQLPPISPSQLTPSAPLPAAPSPQPPSGGLMPLPPCGLDRTPSPTSSPVLLMGGPPHHPRGTTAGIPPMSLRVVSAAVPFFGFCFATARGVVAAVAARNGGSAWNATLHTTWLSPPLPWPIASGSTWRWSPWTEAHASMQASCIQIYIYIYIHIIFGTLPPKTDFPTTIKLEQPMRPRHF